MSQLWGALWGCTSCDNRPPMLIVIAHLPFKHQPVPPCGTHHAFSHHQLEKYTHTNHNDHHTCFQLDGGPFVSWVVVLYFPNKPCGLTELNCRLLLLRTTFYLSLIHISEPTRLLSISYAVFCLKKKKKTLKTSNLYKGN
eukprot:TRINITY_DN1402_c0_g1_i9.p2 TRINITY_DN1402_c0_g1~~TRINITY_DN1402_c0_g1_i9.p2  ORF type:complete len:140 (+),score=6.92 TRINITY_DN1402_c0_g1_i9:1352-1771(+)